MTREEKYSYWLMLSDYDIETVPVLIAGERWVYVAYLCQQAVERQMKGMYMYYNDAEAPKTHNLNFLFSKTAGSEKFCSSADMARFEERKDEIEDFLIDLMFYYMSDYPFSYKNIVNRFVTPPVARELYEKTKDILSFLRSFLPPAVPVALPNEAHSTEQS